MKDNLVSYIDKLTEFEKVFLIRMTNLYGKTQIHLGTLPFLSRKVACTALNDVIKAVSASSDAEIAKAKNILSKLGVGTVRNTAFKMKLNDKKVFQWSQGDSTQGRLMRLPTKKIVEAGMTWNAFRRKWVSPEIEVHHQIVLSRGKDGMWLVECEVKLESIARDYLAANYGNVSEVINEGMLALYKKTKRHKRR